MMLEDTCCTLAPYFKIHEGQVEAWKAGCPDFVAKTREEGDGCRFYGFSFDGETAHCREGYRDADAVLAHLDNVGELLKKALAISDLTRLEVHGPASEIDKLREPLSGLNPQFFTVEFGFRR
jgi:quinol monooxygenase YgiN